MPPSIPLARRRSPWVFVAAAVSGALVLAVVVLALIFTTGNTTEIAAAGPTTDLLADRALKRCVDLWNSEENATARMQFTVLGNWGDVYASVTHSTDYPDKCLISAAAPAADMALQSIETGNDERDALHMPFSLADQVSPNGLADLVGGWNATIDDDGLVALN